MKKRGRYDFRSSQYDSRRGSRSALAKLTEDDVRAIRAARGESGGRLWYRRQMSGAVPCAILAEIYGVTPGAISNIARRITWKHVP